MRFRPPFWAWIVTLLAVALLGSLAHWQFQRGQQKADIIAGRQAEAQRAPLEVDATRPLPAHGRRIALRGQWLGQREVLLDNQTRARRVGVHVWTPLRLAGRDELVLVDRGWLAASAYRDRLPDTGALPAGPQRVTGLWRSLPEAGLAPPVTDCIAAESWPQRLNYPGHAQLECLYSVPVAEGLLLLDADAADGFARDWADLGVPPTRHYGYALQWALLALTALVLFIILNLKRKNHD